MNDFDERRRALLGDGGVPPLWVFKEGFGLQSNVTIDNTHTEYNRPVVRTSYIYGQSKGVGENGACIPFNVINFTPYKVLHLDIKFVSAGGSQGSNFSFGCYNTPNAYQSNFANSIFSYPSNNLNVINHYTFDITSITGNKYLWAKTGRTTTRSAGSHIYIYNLWLE